MIHLDHRDSRPIYLQIADAFRRQIEAGVLSPGDKLPSVRELSASLTINPNTIQRAYRDLEQQGWVASVPGKGCFVCGVPKGMPGQQEKLLQEFDELTARLLAAGVTPEELALRIQKGGKFNA